MNIKYFGFTKLQAISNLKILLAVSGLGKFEEDGIRAAIKFLES
jgi:hypothetical protein